ncbi:MAG: efflux RND transporter permease subunit, partial [Gammaproteobacteria bacterium]
GRIYAMNERAFDALRHGYDRTLLWVLDHAPLTMLTFVAIFVATGVLFAWMPKGFLPVEDNGQIVVFTEAAQDVSFDAMVAMQQKVAAIVHKNPYVAG